MTDNSKRILIQLSIYLILGLLLLIIMIEGSIGLIPYGLIIIGGITFVFAAIARLLRGTWKYKRLLSISKVFLFTGLISILLFLVIVRIQLKVTKNNADILIQKIETYKKDNGHYPYSLESLKPKYIERLPKAWIGILPKDFIYDYSEQLDHNFMYFKPINQASDYHFWIGYYGYIGVEYFYNSKDTSVAFRFQTNLIDHIFVL